ncbi:MAG: hypothetical protein ABFD21_06850 [Anaerolineaceae bacterium]
MWEAFIRILPGNSLTFELFKPEMDEAFLSPAGSAAQYRLSLSSAAITHLPLLFR